MDQIKTYKDLIEIFMDEKRFFEELQTVGFIKPVGKCPRCRNKRVLTRNTQYRLNYAAKCKKCKTRKYSCLTKGTFFENTKLSITNIMEIGYCWASGFTQRVAVRTTGLSTATVNQYYRFFRDIASWKLLQEEFVLGGSGHIIQIDESVITRRKYNRGRVVREKWVLGIYDATTKEGIVLFVEKRDADTLLPIISKHVKPGSTIWTDEWKAYNKLKYMNYEHKTVNHSKHFKDPINGVCTNGVEALWSRLKAYLRRQCVQHSLNIAEHIDEYMWRMIYAQPNTNPFKALLQQIGERYKV